MKLSKAEIDAIIAASPRTTVPFNKLVLSASYQARPRDSKSRLRHCRTRRLDQGGWRSAEPGRRSRAHTWLCTRSAPAVAASPR